MEVLQDLWSLISAALIFLGGAAACISIGRHLGTGLRRSAALYVWHTVMCFAYLAYALAFGADAVEYYLEARTGQHEWQFGTSAVTYLTAAVVQTLQLSMTGTFLLYNILGCIGLLAFDASLREAVRNTQRPLLLATCVWLPFLPSISFWSSAIGKDSIAFMAAALALWAAVELRRRWPLLLATVLVMLLVRPHMAAVMVVALVVEVLLVVRLPLHLRLVAATMSLVLAVLMVPLALEYSGLGDDLSSAALEGYVEQRQGYNTEGGGGIEMSELSPLHQVFAYMFRPTLVEARSIFFLAAAIDNGLLLVLFVSGLVSILRIGILPGQPQATASLVYMWVYLLLAWFSLATTTANLGIALRQKWMFAPVLIYLMVLALAGRHQGAFPVLNKPRQPVKIRSIE